MTEENTDEGGMGEVGGGGGGGGCVVTGGGTGVLGGGGGDAIGVDVYTWLGDVLNVLATELVKGGGAGDDWLGKVDGLGCADEKGAGWDVGIRPVEV